MGQKNTVNKKLDTFEELIEIFKESNLLTLTPKEIELSINRLSKGLPLTHSVAKKMQIATFKLKASRSKTKPKKNKKVVDEKVQQLKADLKRKDAIIKNLKSLLKKLDKKHSQQLYLLKKENKELWSMLEESWSILEELEECKKSPKTKTNIYKIIRFYRYKPITNKNVVAEITTGNSIDENLLNRLKSIDLLVVGKYKLEHSVDKWKEEFKSIKFLNPKDEGVRRSKNIFRSYMNKPEKMIIVFASGIDHVFEKSIASIGAKKSDNVIFIRPNEGYLGLGGLTTFQIVLKKMKENVA